MDFEQFKTDVVEEMSERFPDCEIHLQDVTKLQGESYTGLSIRPEGSSVAASMNLADAFERVNSNSSFNLDDAMNWIADQITEITGNMPQFDVMALSDYDQMKDRLVLEMIPIAGNEERLAEIPHKEVEDMAVVYRFELDRSEQGGSTILLTNTLMESYDITADQLHADALEAAVENRPATLRNMNDVMRELMGDMADMMIPDEQAPIWVASVEGGQHGASALQYPDFLEQAAETLGGDFFVLPSSIHECLFVPDDGSMQLEYLEQMVRDVNETQVAPADRLSDNVYHYDSEAHIFENARTFEAREAAKEEAMLADTITVLLVEPGEYPQVIEAKTGLEDLQALVGGNIEVTYPFDDNVGLIMNEEGKIEGLPLNRALRDDNGEIYDVVAGPFLVAGLTEDSFGSLTQEQAGKFEEMFHQPEAFVKMGRSIMAIPIPEESMEAREAAKAKAPEEIGAKPKHKKSEHDGH